VGDLRREMMEEGIEVEKGGDDGGLPGVLRWMRKEMGARCFGAVVDGEDDGKKEGLPPLVSLESISCTSKGEEQTTSSWVCVLGNEGNGIRKKVLTETNFRIRIGMAAGVDSLSLPVAAGILIHGLSRLKDV
jgi:tRNA G18 (ribose-2'-O)-methylase SpoU